MCQDHKGLEITELQENHIYVVHFHSSDENIGWMGKEELATDDDLIDFLCSLDLPQRFPVDKYGKSYIEIWLGWNGAELRMPDSLIALLSSFADHYRALEEEYYDHQRGDALTGPGAARDFGDY